MYTKTLRAGDSNVFALNLFTCSVSGLEMYFRVSKAIKIKVSSGFLFTSVSKHGNVTCKAMDPSAAQPRLDLYVEQLKGSLSSAHFSLHGFQSGAVISMALAEISVDQIFPSSFTAIDFR